jgi:hypothetical protein
MLFGFWQREIRGSAMHSRTVLDGRHLLDRERVTRARFKHIGLPG